MNNWNEISYLYIETLFNEFLMYECIQKTTKKVSDNNEPGAINGSEKAGWGDDGGGGGAGGRGGMMGGAGGRGGMMGGGGGRG